MEEELVDPPPSLDTILHRVKPLYRYEQTPENILGRLHYVQNGNPDHAFSYDPVQQEEATDVRQLAEIDFLHAISEDGRFMPTMREIVSQLPKRYIDRVHAVEIVLELSSIERLTDDCYKGKAILYEKV